MPAMNCRSLVLALALAALSVPASAATLGGFADVASSYELSNADTPRLTVQPVGPVAVAGMPVLLEQTALADITAKFGGSLQTGEDAAKAPFSFVCYGLKDRTLWFRADGGGSNAAVDMVAIQNGGAQPGWGCTDAPDGLDTVSFGIPGLGAPTEEVSARLGSGNPDASGDFGYLSETPSDAQAGAFVRQTILYRVSDGTVNALSVTQKTSE